MFFFFFFENETNLSQADQKSIIRIELSSEPSIRGILIACANVCVTLGFFIVLYLNTLMSWRQVALICSILPLITMIAICFVSINLLLFPFRIQIFFIFFLL